MRKSIAFNKAFALLLCLTMAVLPCACAETSSASDNSAHAVTSDASSHTDTAQNSVSAGPQATESDITGNEVSSATEPSGGTATESATTPNNSAGKPGNGTTSSRPAGTTSSGGTVSSTASKDETSSSKKVTYRLPDGTTITVDEGTDIMKYTMALATKKTAHQYGAIEQEIFRLCNIERGKNGLAPLEWYEDAYYFTKIRAEEDIASPRNDHIRPDGRQCQTVYSDKNVLLRYFGENICRGPFDEQTMARICVDGWMNSPSHKANILKKEYKYMTVALVVADDGKAHIVQHFFG